ncbi:MAG: hypothetical protein DSM106950_43245 [Stigonema ocellatum SAG 48.90 = DSM 106950]|nr:hypothetical protein [Stigonema ocellatum SAG 48.90 = DSM 106950]
MKLKLTLRSRKLKQPHTSWLISCTIVLLRKSELQLPYDFVRWALAVLNQASSCSNFLGMIGFKAETLDQTRSGTSCRNARLMVILFHDYVYLCRGS